MSDLNSRTWVPQAQYQAEQAETITEPTEAFSFFLTTESYSFEVFIDLLNRTGLTEARIIPGGVELKPTLTLMELCLDLSSEKLTLFETLLKSAGKKELSKGGLLTKITDALRRSNLNPDRINSFFEALDLPPIIDRYSDLKSDSGIIPDPNTLTDEKLAPHQKIGTLTYLESLREALSENRDKLDTRPRRKQLLAPWFEWLDEIYADTVTELSKIDEEERLQNIGSVNTRQAERIKDKSWLEGTDPTHRSLVLYWRGENASDYLVFSGVLRAAHQLIKLSRTQVFDQIKITSRSTRKPFFWEDSKAFDSEIIEPVYASDKAFRHTNVYGNTFNSCTGTIEPGYFSPSICASNAALRVSQRPDPDFISSGLKHVLFPMNIQGSGDNIHGLSATPENIVLATISAIRRCERIMLDDVSRS